MVDALATDRSDRTLLSIAMPVVRVRCLVLKRRAGPPLANSILSGSMPTQSQLRVSIEPIGAKAKRCLYNIGPPIFVASRRRRAGLVSGSSCLDSRCAEVCRRSSQRHRLLQIFVSGDYPCPAWPRLAAPCSLWKGRIRSRRACSDPGTRFYDCYSPASAGLFWPGVPLLLGRPRLDRSNAVSPLLYPHTPPTRKRWRSVQVIHD
jgi:hypothetical protein